MPEAAGVVTPPTNPGLKLPPRAAPGSLVSVCNVFPLCGVLTAERNVG